MTLVALCEVTVGCRTYLPGEALPAGTGLEGAWLEAGSAAGLEEYLTVRRCRLPKAKSAAAPPGAVGMAGTGEENGVLVGCVPERRRMKG